MKWLVDHMEEGNIIRLLPVDWNTLVRNIYPGLVLASFLYWRHDEAWSSSVSFFFGILALILGIPFYAFYRGVLYYPIIRYIEKWTVGIPQYEFHLSIAEELNSPQKIKTLEIANVCYSHLLMTKASSDFRASNSVFNALVHVLFMTAIFCLIAFGHDLMFLGFQTPWVWLWPLACIILFGGGITFDRQADLRETMFLQQNREEYKRILRTYICQNEQEPVEEIEYDDIKIRG